MGRESKEGFRVQSLFEPKENRKAKPVGKALRLELKPLLRELLARVQIK